MNKEEYPEHIQAKIKELKLEEYSTKEILKIAIKSSLEIRNLINFSNEPKGTLTETLSKAEATILEYMDKEYSSIK